MRLLILAANLGGWPVIQLVLARLFLRISDETFAHDSWLTRRRGFEHGAKIYRVLAVRRWKASLPDGGSWLGGRPKRVVDRTHAGLHALLIETRRAETAHWCMLLCTPIFFLWNPMWACGVMTCYGVAANLPCIIAQRANRIQIARILARSSRSMPFLAPTSAIRTS
jgi:glycosyl-4,4'-diaponeurosporenoate acyltransferase